MFEGDALLDLIKFRSDPWVSDISVGVQSSKSLQTLVGAPMIDEPSGTLWEQEDQSSCV